MQVASCLPMTDCRFQQRLSLVADERFELHGCSIKRVWSNLSKYFPYMEVGARIDSTSRAVRKSYFLASCHRSNQFANPFARKMGQFDSQFTNYERSQSLSTSQLGRTKEILAISCQKLMRFQVGTSVLLYLTEGRHQST